MGCDFVAQKSKIYGFSGLLIRDFLPNQRFSWLFRIGIGRFRGVVSTVFAGDLCVRGAAKQFVVHCLFVVAAAPVLLRRVVPLLRCSNGVRSGSVRAWRSDAACR